MPSFCGGLVILNIRVDVQLFQHRGNIFRVHQIQAFGILLSRDTLSLSQLCQRVQVGIGIKALMVDKIRLPKFFLCIAMFPLFPII